MKKLLYTLLAVSMIFSACKKEEAKTTSSTTSSICGNIDVTENGVNLTYTPSPYSGCDEARLTYNNGSLMGVVIPFVSWSGGTMEWQCNAVIENFTSIPINIGQTYSGTTVPSSPNVLNLSFWNMINGTSMNNHPTIDPLVKNGTLKITNIDYTNNLIDGNFSFTGYQVLGGSSKQITCTFSDVPFTIVQ